MSNVTPINTPVMQLSVVNTNQLAVSTELTCWEAASEHKRDKAAKRMALLMPLLEAVDLGCFKSISAAVDSFLIEVKLFGEQRHPVAFELGRKGKAVSRASILGWAKKYASSSRDGLVAASGGSTRRNYGWELRALSIWQSPQNRYATTVAAMLRKEGNGSATDSRVREYLKSLPADVLATGRAGLKLFSNQQLAYTRISTDHLLPGDVYQGDGNTVDVYMQHPTGKRVWRPELTVWLDVASRVIVGWHLSSAESGNSTLFALSHAMISQDHIPAMIHIDNGSGFKNKMLNDLETGFYHQFGISVMKARPYNAKGKGRVERFFQTMQTQLLTRFDSFCGHSMDPEAKKALVKAHAKGEANLPTAEDFKQIFQEWLDTEYHQNPHRGLNGKSPIEVYNSTRRQEKLNSLSEAIFWPRKELTVNRETVRLAGHEYSAANMGAYNGKKVWVEYNPHSTLMVRILQTNGSWVCDAHLINAKQYVTTDRLELARNKSAEAALKLHYKKAEEIKRRARLDITHDQQLNDPVLAATHADPIADRAGDINPLNDLNNSSSTNIDMDDLY